jgi:short-subunit dehydrogenase
MNLTDKRIILTGAAGGIGYLVAKRLAEKGARLLLVERNEARITEICAEINQLDDIALAMVVDLSAEGAPQQVVDMAIQEMGGIDMVINNAGIMDFALFDQLDALRIAQTIQVNVTAPMLLTHAVLPHLLAQNSGRIVNIGSTFGSIGFAHFAPYCAS